jgi:uncharacterized protein YecE (DUF72 family)
VIFIGTSGWQYADWRGRFYPQGTSQREWLSYFAERLPTVEINNSFYMLPKASSFESWRNRTPADFRFAVKANRYITHLKRLKEPEEPVARFMERARLLGEKLGPVLYQLPPTFPADLQRLEGLLDVIPGDVPAAFEFRHASWDTDDVRGLLDARGCAWVLADRPGWRVPLHVTGGWSFVRFHQGRRIHPGYTRKKLRDWAARLASLPARDVWVYFNNDPLGAALRDAATLTELLEAFGADVRGTSRDALRPAA